MAHDSHPRTLVIIPAYNEADSITSVVTNIRRHVPWADIAVINDGSTDATGPLAEAAGAAVLYLPHNVGIGASVQTGCLYAERAGYEVIVRSDGDGQHTPEDIARLLRALGEQNADVVIGSRYLEQRGYNGSAARRAGSLLLAGLIGAIIGQRVTDPTSGFTAANRRALRLCARAYPHDYPEPEAIVTLHRAGLSIVEIPVTMRPRQGGRSSITSLHSAYYMAKVTLAILIGLLRPAPSVPDDPQP
jgi:glycosyltransferase involved in cell wall biosynthesis